MTQPVFSTTDTNEALNFIQRNQERIYLMAYHAERGEWIAFSTMKELGEYIEVGYSRLLKYIARPFALHKGWQVFKIADWALLSTEPYPHSRKKFFRNMAIRFAYMTAETASRSNMRDFICYGSSDASNAPNSAAAENFFSARGSFKLGMKATMITEANAKTHTVNMIKFKTRGLVFAKHENPSDEIEAAAANARTKPLLKLDEGGKIVLVNKNNQEAPSSASTSVLETV